MQHFSTTTIATWERFYRANFVNSLSGFKSVSFIVTINQKGITNLTIFSSVIHLGSDPALIGFVNRPIKAAPHTLAIIQSTGTCTINHIHPAFLELAHQTSAKYPEEVSDFDELGLTAEWIETIEAPFVKESIVKYALTLE